ncbi:MAG: protein translocase subunit SecF [Desulfitobacteriaceae bacterium]|nr:protein translocase subunit SecF [Desulfitobacteriaceae bacterium]MDD4751840.1 protein translocase subunit SecF [Desulfitobacteriaceae bacterium]
MKLSFEIIKRRKIWYILSLFIIIPGIISLFIQGLNLGIDFTGGNLMQIKFTQEVSSTEVREVFSQHIEQGFSVQETEDNNYLVRTGVISEEQNQALIADLSSKFGDNEVLRNEHVGPVIGKELTLKALYALAIAAVLMVIYITFRFEFKFAIAAIIALLHDVFVILGAFSILQLEVDSSFVAAVLTIVGYSINDTIVIFDRIRENLNITRKIEDVGNLVNHSLMQTLARSINTVVTTLFPLVALILFGGVTIKVFALALLIGIISGCYSSIFIASSIWVELRNNYTQKKLTKARA